MGIVRAETIARMRGAIREGLSASRFISDMRAIGLSYRRGDMLADWRTEKGVKRVEGALRFVRKGYVPSDRLAEVKTWVMTKEYMYKMRCQSVYAGVPAEKPTFINIMSNVPRTIESLEEEAWERMFPQSPLKEGEERIFTAWSAFREAK